MTPTEYQQLALRTSGGIQTPLPQRLAIAALGLCGESAEFCLELTQIREIEKEAGDVFWYVSEICDTLNIDIQALFDSASKKTERGLGTTTLLINACQFADHAKKIAGHGHELERHLEPMAEHLEQVVIYMLSTLSELKLPIEQVMTANIDKLNKRYAEGFSSEASKGRTA